MFRKNTKGIFVELSDFSLLTAVTTSLNSPFTIESLNEVSSSEEAENVRDFVEGLSESKARGLFHGHCSVYPTSRFVRRTALDSVSKSRDEGFFANMLNSQFRIDPEQHTSEVLHATNGAHFDPETATPSQKEILLCGAGADGIAGPDRRIRHLSRFAATGYHSQSRRPHALFAVEEAALSHARAGDYS